MGRVSILHIDSDVECNFLFTEYFRKDPRIVVEWASSRAAADKVIRQSKYDIIVCNGELIDTRNPLKDIEVLKNHAHLIFYTPRKADFKFSKIAHRSFYKSSEGVHSLIKYLKTYIEGIYKS